VKIRHGDLEIARKDPIAWRRSLAGRSGGGLSQHMLLLHAVHRFHRQGERIDQAIEHLHELFRRHYVKPADLARLEAQLVTYADAYRTQTGRAIGTRIRVSHPIGPDLVLAGEIARLDLIPGGGYAAWLFGRVTEPWHDQLRMPLLQQFVATRMGAPIHEVSVGFYRFDTGTYEGECFSCADIDAAVAESAGIARVLAGEPADE
jgi:hypothetical protein